MANVIVGVSGWKAHENNCSPGSNSFECIIKFCQQRHPKSNRLALNCKFVFCLLSRKDEN